MLGQDGGVKDEVDTVFKSLLTMLDTASSLVNDSLSKAQ